MRQTTPKIYHLICSWGCVGENVSVEGVSLLGVEKLEFRMDDSVKRLVRIRDGDGSDDDWSGDGAVGLSHDEYRIH